MWWGKAYTTETAFFLHLHTHTEVYVQHRRVPGTSREFYGVIQARNMMLIEAIDYQLHSIPLHTRARLDAGVPKTFTFSHSVCVWEPPCSRCLARTFCCATGTYATSHGLPGTHDST